MSYLKVSIYFSLALLMILGVAFLALDGWSAEAARSTAWIDQDEVTVTPASLELFPSAPTPVTGINPPDFPDCPEGFEILGTFDDYLRRDNEPKYHSYPVSLSEDGVILLQGWVMEGHPDLGCPGHPDCDDIQDHEDIIFEMDGDILGIYEDSEHGPYENAWYFFGPMSAEFNSGTHTLTFRHTMYGEDAQSVGYRFSLCGPAPVPPTPTFTLTSTFTPLPEPTSTPTPMASATPTEKPSSTPEPEFTPTPTYTPQPLSGLAIFGSVQVDDTAADGDMGGLAGVNIHLGFASYPGNIVAVTDEEGRYRSEFIQIPVDETIRVWGSRDGYEFQPEMETWRFYAGYYQERQIDFIAYPEIGTVTPITPTSTMTPTFTPTPTSTPTPLKSNCQLPPKPRSPQGYYLFEEVGKIYDPEGILNFQGGTVSTWMCLEPDHARRDHVIFHTSDSRFILYVDTYFSGGMQREIFRVVARAGGTHRAVDSGYANGNFPEASIIVDNDGSLVSYKHEWYSPAPFPEGEWHLVTMAWNGYPQGEVKIFLDGNLLGKKSYDERYNDDRPLADSIAIGFRPSEWIGEIYVSGEQQGSQLVPSTSMALWEGGIQVSDLRLYNRPLNRDEIVSIFLEGRPYP
jgi:hypothetical protein